LIFIRIGDVGLIMEWNMSARKKDQLRKICPVCLRSFSWRKKWQKCWDEVKYCSYRCRQQSRHCLKDNVSVA
jgi:hypothetical protein